MLFFLSFSLSSSLFCFSKENATLSSILLFGIQTQKSFVTCPKTTLVKISGIKRGFCGRGFSISVSHVPLPVPEFYQSMTGARPWFPWLLATASGSFSF